MSLVAIKDTYIQVFCYSKLLYSQINNMIFLLIGTRDSFEDGYGAHFIGSGGEGRAPAPGGGGAWA